MEAKQLDKNWLDLSIQRERGRFKSKCKSIFESCLLKQVSI